MAQCNVNVWQLPGGKEANADMVLSDQQVDLTLGEERSESVATKKIEVNTSMSNEGQLERAICLSGNSQIEEPDETLIATKNLG